MFPPAAALPPLLHCLLPPHPPPSLRYGAMPPGISQIYKKDDSKCIITRPQRVPATRIELGMFVLLEPYSEFFGK